MSNEKKEISNIYDCIIIFVKDDKTFTIRNTLNDSTIISKVKDIDTALSIKRSYFKGWYDAKHHYCGETNGKD